MRRLSNRELKNYWSNLSEQCLDDDTRGLSVICYAGMPNWFNAFVDRYQRKAFEKLAGDVRLSEAMVLDIGTGVGRWARWFASLQNTRVIGIDIEPQRLKWAQRRSATRIQYCIMSADHLSFSNGAFDVVNCIAVLQHVPDSVKRKAIAEMARVLKPHGHAIVFELIDEADDAPHVFPWSREAWLKAFQANGFSLLATAGDQYTPLLRLLKSVFKRLYGPQSRRRIDDLKRTPDRVKGQSLYLALLRFLVLLSYPLEELCRLFVPPQYARVNGYLLVKERD